MTIISEEHNQLSFSRRASEVPFRACHVVMVHAVLTLRESRVYAATGEKERVK